jgi:hypothetical protein
VKGGGTNLKHVLVYGAMRRTAIRRCFFLARLGVVGLG